MSSFGFGYLARNLDLLSKLQQVLQCSIEFFSPTERVASLVVAQLGISTESVVLMEELRNRVRNLTALGHRKEEVLHPSGYILSTQFVLT